MTIDAAEHSQLVLRHVRGAQRTARRVEQVLIRIPHPDPVELTVATRAEGDTRTKRVRTPEPNDAISRVSEQLAPVAARCGGQLEDLAERRCMKRVPGGGRRIGRLSERVAQWCGTLIDCYRELLAMAREKVEHASIGQAHLQRTVPIQIRLAPPTPRRASHLVDERGQLPGTQLRPHPPECLKYRGRTRNATVVSSALARVSKAAPKRP